VADIGSVALTRACRARARVAETGLRDEHFSLAISLSTAPAGPADAGGADTQSCKLRQLFAALAASLHRRGQSWF
jgi:hypothetical protein